MAATPDYVLGVHLKKAPQGSSRASENSVPLYAVRPRFPRRERTLNPLIQVRILAPQLLIWQSKSPAASARRASFFVEMAATMAATVPRYPMSTLRSMTPPSLSTAPRFAAGLTCA